MMLIPIFVGGNELKAYFLGEKPHALIDNVGCLALAVQPPLVLFLPTFVKADFFRFP